MSDLLSQLEEQDRQHRLKMQQHNEEQERLRKDPKVIAEFEKLKALEKAVEENLLACINYAKRVKELVGDREDKIHIQSHPSPPVGYLKVYCYGSDRHFWESTREFNIHYDAKTKKLKVTCESSIPHLLGPATAYSKRFYFPVNELNKDEMGRLMEWVIGESNHYSKSRIFSRVGCTIAFLLFPLAIYLLFNSIWHWLKTII